ncbi:hypothetical protein F5146DRAFT_1172537 [Armillaria mellea]|nr:hypothetical protein F5146DRAFT_1172537 [Armillaria mellea]
MPLFDFVVSHPAEWPTEIKDLACSLDSPIPSQLVNGPCPTISSRASPLLEELRNSLTNPSEHPAESDSEILDILDLVLSTVGKLRALSNASNNDSVPSTIPFWSLLIRSLAFVCYDESYITQEAAFVRPRLSYVRSFMEDGHASLLISHIVEDIQRPKSAVNDEASGHLSMMTAERSNGESREESDSYDDESSSDTSYDHPTFPLMLTSSLLGAIQNSVVLPFLCVTDEEDIFSLMSGVLYQRSTWGISEPIIGIILSNTGFIGRVVLGWLDKECPDPEILPAIRFAYGDETRIDAALGVYDLTNPASAVKFSQFILGLRTHVEGIVAQCRTPTFKRLSWRSDSIDDDNSGTEEQWKQRIVNWLNAVAKCRAPFESTSSYSCSFPMTDSEKRRNAVVFEVKSLQLRVRRPHLMELPSSLWNVAGKKHSQTAGRPQTGKTGKRAKSADALSCSALGAKSLAGISPDAKLSFSTYAYERHITGLTNAQFKVDAEELKKSKMPASQIKELTAIASEINEMLEFYEKITQFMKPPLEHELPVVDKRVEDVREHFLSQIEVFRESKNTPELPQDFWKVISGSLSSLLWASVGGYSKGMGGKDHNETEARHEWDILLNLGFVNTHELASGRIVLERALSLSRNVAAELANSSVKFNGEAFQTVADLGHNISRLATHVVTLALDHRLEVRKLFQDADKAKRAILKRNGDEPELGIVDAILTIPLEHGSKSSESLIRITETRQTVQASRTLNANNIVEPDNDSVYKEGPPTSNGRTAKSKSSRARSTRTASTSAQMVAIEEEQAAAHALSPGAKKKKNAEAWKWMHPFAVTCSETKLAPGIKLPSESAKLLLAVLLVEYKKQTQTYAKALVQAKMYLEASVRFLASLGVTKQGVFALVTDGVKGAILMAWCSSVSDSERVYIVERNVRTVQYLPAH